MNSARLTCNPIHLPGKQYAVRYTKRRWLAAYSAGARDGSGRDQPT